MDVKQVGSRLFQITRNRVFNGYLVCEPDGLTLIDTLIPGSASLILEQARQLEQSLRRIVITHAHHDHVGSLDALVARLPDVEVLISAREARILAGDRSSQPFEPQDALRGEFTVCTARATRLLQPGDRVGSLEVIASPGHTPGHLALFDPRDGSLFAGDAYANLFQFIVAGYFTPLFPISAQATWNKPLALDSAKRLHDLAPSRLACGHGPVLERPVLAMTEAIERAARNEAFTAVS